MPHKVMENVIIFSAFRIHELIISDAILSNVCSGGLSEVGSGNRQGFK